MATTQSAYMRMVTGDTPGEIEAVTADSLDSHDSLAGQGQGQQGQQGATREEQALPLPGWLKNAYYVFPLVLYVPDMLFNYYVFSDGAGVPNEVGLVQATSIVLWAFLAVGIVGMQYLLSVLAPWHWRARHRGAGVLLWSRCLDRHRHHHLE
jgi:hypothetical protein